MHKQIEKAFVSFRIATFQWAGDEQFEGLMALFEKHKGVTDEITFFLSVTHSPATLEYIQEHCKILAKRMERCRELGYKTGINILCTTGHHNENLPNMLKGDYYHLTDLKGDVSHGTYCPNDEKYRQEYLKYLYEYMSQANPDYIWIDDDVRLMGHMPIMETCFCDNCIKIFSGRMDKTFTRETLKEEFDGCDESSKLEVRKAWLEHNRQTITSLLEYIEQTVHAVNPKIALGFMDGARFYEGLALEEWAKALGSDERDDVMWRPGAGTYSEDFPSQIFSKAHVMGLEGAVLPDSVRIIESELESFPYPRLGKSTHYTALEADVYTAAGCTGTAFNVLTMGDEPLDDYDALVKKLKDNRPFLDLLAKSFGRNRRKGIFSIINRDCYAAKNLSGSWFGGTGWMLPGWGTSDQLYLTGFPVAYSLQDATAITLTGDIAVTFDDAQIKKILSGGVYMDGEALGRLNEMGYGELTGFKIKAMRHHDTIEKFTAHHLNAKHEGFMRDTRQSFWKIPAYCLTPSADAKILSYPIDYTFAKIDECCSGVFENKLGGRICVAGYCPWEHLHFGPKMTQLKKNFRWLSKASLNSYIQSYHRISMWDSIVDGKHVTALVNGYLDAAEKVELMLKADFSGFEIIDMNCNSMILESEKAAAGYQKLTIPQISPWQMVLVKEL